MLQAIEGWIDELEIQEGGSRDDKTKAVAILKANYLNYKPGKHRLRTAPLGSGTQDQKELATLYYKKAEEFNWDLAQRKEETIPLEIHNKIVTGIINDYKAIYKGKAHTKAFTSLDLRVLTEEEYVSDRPVASEPLKPSDRMQAVLNTVTKRKKPEIKSTFKNYRLEPPLIADDGQVVHPYLPSTLTMDYNNENDDGLFPDESDIIKLMRKKPYRRGGAKISDMSKAIVIKGSEDTWLRRTSGARTINKKWTSILSELAKKQSIITDEISAGNKGE